MVAPKTLQQRREYVADPQLARVDQARDDLATLLRSIPFLRGRLVSVAFSGAGSKAVRHGLGVPAAFIVIRQNYLSNAGPVYAESDVAAQALVDQKQYLAVQVDRACTVDLWFYARASRKVDAGQGQSP